MAGIGHERFSHVVAPFPILVIGGSASAFGMPRCIAENAPRKPDAARQSSRAVGDIAVERKLLNLRQHFPSTGRKKPAAADFFEQAIGGVAGSKVGGSQ